MGNQQNDSREAVFANRVVQVTDYVIIDYADTTQKLIAWLPAGAVILDVLANVTALFNDSGTDYLVVGDSDTEDLYADDIDLSAVAMKVESQNTTPVVPGIRLTEDTAIYAKYNGANADATAGSAQVSVMWVPSTRKELDT